jgi:F0F1-type ATP synthase membrane subunit b/b'
MTRREAETLQRLLAQGPPQDAEASPGHGAADGETAELACLGRALAASSAQPSPRFPDALRQRVLAVAADEAADEPPPTWRARMATVWGDLAAAWRFATRSAVASGTVTVGLLLAGIFVGASLSLPGDPLYAIKDAYQQAQLSRASAPSDIAAEKLDVAATKITDVVRAAERDRPESLATSAHKAESLVRDSAATLLSVYRESGEPAVLMPLARFADGHQTTVADVRRQTHEGEAKRALAGLAATLNDVDAQVTDILGRCCQPTSQAGRLWRISTPQSSLVGCPCPRPALDERQPNLGTAAGAATEILDLAPRTDDGHSEDTSRPPHDRIHEGVDETHQQVDDATEAVDDATDTLDNATDETTEAVDDATNAATDTIDEATDETTEAVDDATDAATDATTDTIDDATGADTDGASDPVDETVDKATDTVDEASDAATNTVDEATDETTKAVDDATDRATDAVQNDTDPVQGPLGGDDDRDSSNDDRDNSNDGGDLLP